MRPFPNNLKFINKIHLSRGGIFKTAIIIEEAKKVNAQSDFSDSTGLSQPLLQEKFTDSVKYGFFFFFLQEIVQ